MNSSISSSLSSSGTEFDTIDVVAWSLYGAVAAFYVVVFHLPPSRYYGPAMFWKPGVVVDDAKWTPTRSNTEDTEVPPVARRLGKRFPHACCYHHNTTCTNSAPSGSSVRPPPTVFESPSIARRWSHVMVNTAQINAIQTLRGPLSLCALYGPGLMQMLSFLSFVDNFLNGSNSSALAVLILCVSIIALVFFVLAMRMIYQLNYLVMVLPQRPQTREELASEAIGIGVGIKEHTDAELSRQQRHAAVALDVIRDATSALMNSVAAESGENAALQQPREEPLAAEHDAPSTAPAAATEEEEARTIPAPPNLTTSGNVPAPHNVCAVSMVDGIHALRDAADRRGYTLGILRDNQNAESAVGASPSPLSEPFCTSPRHRSAYLPSRVTVDELAVVNMLTSPPGVASPVSGGKSAPLASALLRPASHVNAAEEATGNHPRAATLRRVVSGFLGVGAPHAAGDVSAARFDVTAQLLRHLAIEEAFSVQQHEDRLTQLVQLMSWNLCLGIRCLMFLLPPVLGMFGPVPFLVSTCALPAVLWYVDHQW